MDSSVPEEPIGDSYNHSGSGDMFSARGGNATKNVYNGPTNVYQGTEERLVLPQDCWRSLAFPEMDSRSHDIEDAAEGTCKWLSQNKAYKDWASSNRALLWIKGKPGSGKSTLLRYALNDAMKALNIGEAASILSFFFHGRGSELQKTPLGLFRSLLYQLREIPDALSDVVDAFRQRCETVGKPGEKWSWHPGELRNFFKSSILKALKTRPLWLFIDALDECGEENARNLVREFLFLLKWLPTELKDFHICFTCRHYPILDLDGSLEICVENENSPDISTFVQSQLSSLNEQLLSTIPDLITERANGVFLWAWLVVKRVQDLDLDGAGLKQMKDAISSVPPDLDDLYHELLRKMGSDSVKLIQWICFTTRPLSLDELRWALLVEPDCPYRSLDECQRAGDDPADKDGMKRRVQTLSRGLAEVKSDTEVVQFIHQSVKDFFVEKGLSTLNWPNWVVQYIYQSTKDIFVDKGSLLLSDKVHVCRPTTVIGLATALLYLGYFTRYPLSFLPGHVFPLPIVLAVMSAYWLNGVPVENFRGNFIVGTAHYQLSRTCIRYLAMDDIAQSTIRNGSSLKSAFPLLEYATTSWMVHAKHSEERGISQDDLLAYFDWPSEAVVQVWLRYSREYARQLNDGMPQVTQMLHVVSRYGLVGPLRAMLRRAGTDINARDEDGRTPLLVAAERGYTAVVELLLQKRAKVNDTDNHGATPLLAAVQRGHTAVVELLLGKGAEVNDANKRGSAPLIAAAERGHTNVVELLLGKGANIEAANNVGQTPLCLAIINENKAVTSLLLDNGANIEVVTQYGMTPLFLAVMKENKAVTSLLLKKGANVDVVGAYGLTPLLWAVVKDNKAVTSLLLKKGAKVDVVDEQGMTPLFLAVMKENKAVTSLLLKKGANVDVVGAYGLTPLLWAVVKDNKAVTSLLLKKGANVDVVDEQGRTPLLWAVRNGNKAVTSLLLDRGADVEAVDKYGRTPLSWAARNGNKAVTSLLLDKGANVEVVDKYGRTLLSWATKTRHKARYKAVAKLLLEKGAKGKKTGTTPSMDGTTREGS